MAQHSRPALAVLLTGLVLGGCGSGPSPDATASPPASSPSATAPSPTASGSASPSPSSTLTQAQQKAFDDAVQVVMAYRQIVVDLYSGARTSINDLDAVTTGAFRQRTENAVALALAKGYKDTPKGVQLTLADAELLKATLTKDPPTVVVRACVDATDVTVVKPDGTQRPGVREQLDYSVVKTSHLPAPGWAVRKVTGEPKAEDRKC